MVTTQPASPERRTAPGPPGSGSAEQHAGSTQLRDDLRGRPYDEQVQMLAPPEGAAPPGAAPPRSAPDPAARIAQLQAAFGALSGLSANDPDTPRQLGVILAPLGIPVRAPDPSDPRPAGELFLEVLQVGRAAAVARFPVELTFTLNDRGKQITRTHKQPQTLPEVNRVLSLIQMEKANPTGSPNAGLEADAHALNTIFGLEELVRGWRGADPAKQARSNRGAGAAAFAMGFVGQVAAAEPSGETIEAPDRNGKSVEVPACRGHQVFRRMWQESADPGYVAQSGGMATMLDHRQPKPSWCGIFANWVCGHTGLSGAKWVQGGGNMPWLDPGRARASSAGAKIALLKPDPMPGDIAYAMDNSQHFCIVLRVDGDVVHTIDGNTSPGGGASGGQILAQSRAMSWFSHFYEWL